MFAGIKKPATITRKVTVKNEEQKPVLPVARSSHGIVSHKSNHQIKNRVKIQDARHTHIAAHASKLNGSKDSAQHLSIFKATLKRKARSPDTPQWDSDSAEDDDQTSADLISRKRLRSTSHEPSTFYDVKRTIFRVQETSEGDENRTNLVHSADIVSGVYAKEYKNEIFALVPEEDAPVAHLQYPGAYAKERFSLVQSRETRGYEPTQDLIDAVDTISHYYFPTAQAEEYTNDITGYARRLKRAMVHRNKDQFLAIVGDFNAAVQQALESGVLSQTVVDIKFLPLALVERILDQIYSRTVSPEIHSLSKYENGTSNVYGELLPPFSHMIFKETKLKSDQVFVDLGSGVGNAVLQAALEIGCESWGIEQMPNPARLGQKQVEEFEARCKRWGITHGDVKLVEGDFLNNAEIDRVISRADVILINNQVFTPDLNSSIVMKLLDVKEGAKIVSLKSFVPDGWVIKTRTAHDPRNKLRVVKKEYWSKSVSWTDNGGDYYIATVDSAALRKFLRKTGT